mmetsp:Transcript_1854/g.3837  ORF Transcript_1854/g.3837 Transcript_1854/m.3837 type:complete len:772 (+) Transcript_1854:31-2346(+)
MHWCCTCPQQLPDAADDVAVSPTLQGSPVLEKLVADVSSTLSLSRKVYSATSVDNLKQLFGHDAVFSVHTSPCVIIRQSSEGLARGELNQLYLDLIDCKGRFQPDTAQPGMLHVSSMRSMLAGGNNEDNSVLCLTALASSLTRIVAKLQRERILSCLILTESNELAARHTRVTSSISESLHNHIVSTDIQLGRTLELSRLIKVRGRSDRIEGLIRDGIDQFQTVSSKIHVQRERVVAACEDPPKSWCDRYHLCNAGEFSYATLISNLLCWVALAVCSMPDTMDPDGTAHHESVQAACIIVMVFKEQLARERAWLVSKSFSCMVEGSSADEVMVRIISSRETILKAVQTVATGADSGGTSIFDIDFAVDTPWTRGCTPFGATYPPIVDMLRKFEDLHNALRQEAIDKSYSVESNVYTSWFAATQKFFDMLELSSSGLMRHFVLSVPAHIGCFQLDLECTVPASVEYISEAAPLQDGSPGLLGEIMDGLRERRYKRIVALVGAGISVAAGIPDFRSRGGLYDQMRAQGFKNPMSVFTADFLEKEPRTFYEMFKKLRTDHVKPTLVHWFLRLLYDQGCLLRCYTQNIDALERKVEIPMEYIVEAHGTMSEACCLKCGKASTAKELWACWGSGEGELPRCASPGCGGLLRPAVVFFGEQLNPRFIEYSQQDMESADLVLIMGTSLSVEPFASLVQKAGRTCPRLLINRHVPFVMQRRPWELLTPSVLSKWRPARKDASIIGECEERIQKVIGELGWKQMLSKSIGSQGGFPPAFS